MELMVNLACCALEVLAFRTLCASFVPRRRFLPPVTLLLLWAIFVLLPRNGETIWTIVRFCLYLAAEFLIYRGKWWSFLLVGLFSTILPTLLSWLLGTGTAAFFSIHMEELLRRQRNWFVILLMGHFLALLAAWLLNRLVFCRGQLKWSIPALVLPVVSLVMLAVIFFTHLGRNDLSELAHFACWVLTAVNVGMLFLLETMERSTRKRQELALLSQQLQIQTESIRALEKSYRAQRQATHDFQRHLQTLSMLLSAGEAETAYQYVQELQGLQTTRIFSIRSHHPIVDAVLNQRYQLAREKNIDIRVQVNDLSGLSLDLSHLVVLLSNLLDNALEACLSLEGERAIRCSLLLGEGLYLSVSNTSPSVKMHGDRLPTAKNDSREHGYGLPTVCRILQHYGAEYTYEYKEGWFHFAAEIPMDG